MLEYTCPLLESVQYDIADWTNDQDRYSQNTRGHLIRDILCNFDFTGSSSKEHLRAILDSGWDVNETFAGFGFRNLNTTALHIAVQRGCLEAVKVLFDAGAHYQITQRLPNPLVDAILFRDTPDVLRLLLKEGIDPNAHDDELFNVPLLRATYYWTPNQEDKVKLLLENGADPNVVGERYLRGKYNPLHAPFETGCTLFQTLVQYGADVNHKVDGKQPIPHKMVTRYNRPYPDNSLLDMFFQYGGNMSVENCVGETVLEYAVRTNAPINRIRWLLRHGADTSAVNMSQSRRYFLTDFSPEQYPDTTLLLLQAGMRMSPIIWVQLSNIEIAISAWLQKRTQVSTHIPRVVRLTIQQLGKQETEEIEIQRKQYSIRKSNFPEYWNQQMADLEEFSDESLDVYQGDQSVKYLLIHAEWEKRLNEIHRALDFMSEPQSLLWYSRRWVRENLVSLQPSVVKMLPGPARLKRYILCHEI